MVAGRIDTCSSGNTHRFTTPLLFASKCGQERPVAWQRFLMIVPLVDEAGWLKALFASHAERDLGYLGRESKMEYKRKTPSSEYSLQPAV
jgi:hypothetical protein